MIDINSLEQPTVVQELDYEQILQANIDAFKSIVPDWKPLESDEFKIIMEAFAYRELFLRAELNNMVKAFFLSTAQKEDLDSYAVFYNSERIKGSKPYAFYEFELSSPLTQDIIVPKNLVLTDNTSSYEAILLEEVIIPGGTTKAIGTVELQLEISQSDIKTEIITTPLPFVLSTKALDIFNYGSEVESDESFRMRILLSMADKSTAGSEETYKSFTFKADERVDDVSVRNGLKELDTYVSLFIGQDEVGILAALSQLVADIATVEDFYYSKSADELMQSRITESLNSKEVRPLTDRVLISPAIEVPFIVNADLKILPNQETATIYTKAIESLELGLEALKKIGVDITLSEINNFLKIDGVKEAVVSSPAANVEISENEIGVCDVKNITYTII